MLFLDIYVCKLVLINIEILEINKPTVNNGYMTVHVVREITIYLAQCFANGGARMSLGNWYAYTMLTYNDLVHSKWGTLDISSSYLASSSHRRSLCSSMNASMQLAGFSTSSKVRNHWFRISY